MYVRITPIRFDPSRQDAVTEETKDSVLPLLKGLPGFRRYHGAVDRAQGTGLAISYWETHEQALAVSEAVRTIAPRIQAAGIELSAPSIYEVVLEG
jgi:hypothetical protein